MKKIFAQELNSSSYKTASHICETRFLLISRNIIMSFIMLLFNIGLYSFANAISMDNVPNLQLLDTVQSRVDSLKNTQGENGKTDYHKLLIHKTNNRLLDYSLMNIYASDTLVQEEAKELREYVNSRIENNNHYNNFISSGTGEFLFCTTLMNWVSKQWVHDGWNNAGTLKSIEILKNAQNGKRYRCVEYGKVLSDILKAHGLISRVISIQTADAAYGGVGMGHVASEVWSNEFNKWIFMDPQFNIWFSLNGLPLNFYELATTQTPLENIEIHNGETLANKELKDKYIDFIKRYFGYVGIKYYFTNISQEKPNCMDNSICKDHTNCQDNTSYQNNTSCQDNTKSINHQKFSLFLMIQGETQFLTFQGMPRGRNIFTKEPKDLYAELNQTMMIIDYDQSEKDRSNKIMEQCNIKTAAEFADKMHLFSAQPKFIVTLHNNMPWFDKYELYVNGEKIKIIEGNSAELDFTQSNKTVFVIEAWSVNKFGVKGPKLIIHLSV